MAPRATQIDVDRGISKLESFVRTEILNFIQFFLFSWNQKIFLIQQQSVSSSQKQLFIRCKERRNCLEANLAIMKADSSRNERLYEWTKWEGKRRSLCVCLSECVWMCVCVCVCVCAWGCAHVLVWVKRREWVCVCICLWAWESECRACKRKCVSVCECVRVCVCDSVGLMMEKKREERGSRKNLITHKNWMWWFVDVQSQSQLNRKKNSGCEK